MRAKDVMTKQVATVDDHATLSDVARTMWDRCCGFIPVLDSDSGRLCGVITDRDVCMGAWTQGMPLDGIPVRLSMTHDVATCRDDDDLVAIERSMRAHRVRRLPVIDRDRRVVGVVSLDDLARVVLDPDHRAGRHRLAEDVARTLGLVSQPGPFQALRSICAVGPS